MAVIVIIIALSSIRIVRPYEEAVVERLGKFKDIRRQGLILIIPFIERVQKVDTRERVLDVPTQEVITSDNAIVEVDAIIYFKITDSQAVLYKVQSFKHAAVYLAQTNLRNIIGNIKLDGVYASRQQINDTLREVLDEATDQWGVKITRVELKEVSPKIAAAMNKQAEAYKLKQATITEAEGQKEAAMRVAEGKKEAAIREAEGRSQATVMIAEADAKAIILKGKAESDRYKNIIQGIKNGGPTQEVLNTLFVETALPKIADGQSTKIYLPGGLEKLASVSEVLGLQKEKDQKKEKK